MSKPTQKVNKFIKTAMHIADDIERTVFLFFVVPEPLTGKGDLCRLSNSLEITPEVPAKVAEVTTPVIAPAVITGALLRSGGHLIA